MSVTTNTDLQRDLGRVEGKLSAMEDRLDKIDTVLERIDMRLARIESVEGERKGAFSFGRWIAGVVGAGVALIGSHFLSLWK